VPSTVAQDRNVRDAGLGGKDDEPKPPTPLPYSDAQLVAFAREGQPGIDSLLFERLAPVISRVVWTLLGPDSEQDDMMHDVFLRVLRGVGKLRDADRLDDWAARVAINGVRNEMRRRRLRRWVAWNPFEHPEPPAYVPDLDGREVLARAYRALERLPVDERLILSLRLFYDGTLEEVAAAADCSPTTAKRRLKRARERFKRIAEQDALLKPWLDQSSSQGDHHDG
jgi:RNA polymerase sigma-70 factor (ECF subfamily)